MVPCSAFLCSYWVSINADGQHIYALEICIYGFLVFWILCLLPGVTVLHSAEFVVTQGMWHPPPSSSLWQSPALCAGCCQVPWKQRRDKFQSAAFRSRQYQTGHGSFVWQLVKLDSWAHPYMLMVKCVHCANKGPIQRGTMLCSLCMHNSHQCSWGLSVDSEGGEGSLCLYIHVCAPRRGFVTHGKLIVCRQIP